ncbi:MAG TPA: sulfatase [Luteolibacter sp.]
MKPRSLFVSAGPLACGIILSASLQLNAAESPAPTKPNIIVFLVDDMGWQDTSVPFGRETTPLNRKYHTPNMEKLAAGGMKFTQAYATPVCTPSRVSLMTGQNAARHRVTNWTKDKNKSTDADTPRLTLPAWNVNGWSPDPATPRAAHGPALPALLRDAGYRTIHVGKAHFGAEGTPGADPRSLGFDINIAGGALGGPGSYLGEMNYDSPPADRPTPTFHRVPSLEGHARRGEFLTEALTQEAIAELEKAQTDRQPFFLYMAHYAVHVPYAADPRFIAKYQVAGLDPTETMYAALVEGMDKSLGDLMNYLENKGIAKDTVILFMSDNGGLSAHGRGGPRDTHNLPLSCGKGSLHEGGIREPMIIRWPGVAKPDSSCDTPVIIEDFFPTILAIAGAKESPSDGRSFMPQIHGEAITVDPARALIWHFPNAWTRETTVHGYGPGSAVRFGDWKYIFWHDPQHQPREELFNLKEDIGETDNLSDKETAKRHEMAALLRERLEAMGAQMPLDKATGTVIAIPTSPAGTRTEMKTH